MENIRYINEIYENIRYYIISIASVGAVTWYGKDCEITRKAVRNYVHELALSNSSVKKYNVRKGKKLQITPQTLPDLAFDKIHLSEN